MKFPKKFNRVVQLSSDNLLPFNKQTFYVKKTTKEDIYFFSKSGQLLQKQLNSIL